MGVTGPPPWVYGARVAQGSPTAELGRPAIGAALTLGMAMAAHSLVETSRNALFLTAFPASQLPWMYLGGLVGTLGVARVQHRWQRFDARQVLGAMLLLFAAILVGFWLATRGSHSATVLYALYIFSGIYVVVIATQFWLLVSASYTITQAKRVFSFIGAGGIGGAIAGSGVAVPLSTWVGPEGLLLAAAVLLGGGAVATVLGLRHALLEPLQVRDAPKIGAGAFGEATADPYVRRLAVITVLAAVTTTVIDYQYKAWFADAVSPDQLAPAFAAVAFVLNALALLTQLVAVRWVLRTAGVGRAIVVMPALLVLGALALAAGGGLAAVLVLFGITQTLKHTLHNTGMELLYVPVPAQTRATTRSLVAGVAQRAGKAIASVALLALPFVPRPALVIAVSLVGLSLAWHLFARRAGRQYLDMFRAKLKAGRIDADIELPPLDASALESLIAALSSTDDVVVIGALQLLERQGRGRLIPTVLLHHPSEAVVLESFRIFAESGRDDLEPIATRLLDSENPRVRTRALLALARLGVTTRLLEYARGDLDPEVRGAALIAFVATASDDATPVAQRDLADALQKGSSRMHAAMASAVSVWPDRRFVPMLVQLSRRNDAAVAKSAIDAMASIPDDRFIADLMRALGNRTLREAARLALVGIGTPAFEALVAALKDATTPIEVRRHLPRTISRFAPQHAGSALLERYVPEPDGVTRYKIVRGLGKLRRRAGGLRLDQWQLLHATEDTVRAALWALEARTVLEAEHARSPETNTQGGELLVGLLADKQRYALERLTRLLGLLHEDEAFEEIHSGLTAADPQRYGGARELLEAVLEPPIREPVLALVEDGPVPERLERAQPLYAPRNLDYEPLLGELLTSRNDVVVAITVYHIAELGLTQFGDAIAGLQRPPSDEAAGVFDHALAALAAAQSRGSDAG